MGAVIVKETRKNRAKYDNVLCLFILDDNHIRDRALLTTYNVLYSSSFNCWKRNVGNGEAHYTHSNAQFSLVPPGTTGDYTNVVFSGIVVPDSRKYDRTVGESDVFARVKSVEILQNNDIASNIANNYLYVKSTVFKQITALRNEVPSGVYFYEDNCNVPSGGTSEFAVEFYNYLAPEDVNNTSDPQKVILNKKNFVSVHIPLGTALTKSFAFEICMNSEGILQEARVIVSDRKEMGNAS